jgi:hypothetical protein
MANYFTGNEPNAQAKTKQNRLACEQEFINFCKPMPKGPPQAALPCFGSDLDEQNMATKVINGKPVSKTDVEALGEMGAIYFLQKHLAENYIQYDDAGLNIFAGANAFNLVYFHPPRPNEKTAFIIEAKGGNSQLGFSQTQQGPTRQH